MSALRNLTKPSTSNAVTVAGIIILLGLVPFLVYLSLDNHFNVELTSGFTSKGTSDRNVFSVLLGDHEVNSTDELNGLTTYKQLDIPYNSTSGNISTSFVQPQTDKIIGFMNTNTNNTNESQAAIQSFKYTMTDNITNISNSTDTIINKYQPVVDISDAYFELNSGYINQSGVPTNYFNSPPPLVWGNIYDDKWSLENWTPSSTYIGKTITKLYVPFSISVTPIPHFQIHAEIYNATTVFSSRAYMSTDIYNSVYSVLNIMDDEPIVYTGGVLTIHIFTTGCYFWNNFYIGTIHPNNTNSHLFDIYSILGIQFPTEIGSTSLYKGVMTRMEFGNNSIYSQQVWTNGTWTQNVVDVNFTFHLSDYNVSLANLDNISFVINNLYFNTSIPYQMNGQGGYLMFWNYQPPTNYWLNFTNGTIGNVTYLGGTPPRTDLLSYVNHDTTFKARIQVVSWNKTFYMNINDIKLVLDYHTVNNQTNYFTNISMQIDGIVSSALSVTTSVKNDIYGSIMYKLSTQEIQFTVNYTLTTADRTINYVYDYNVTQSIATYTDIILPFSQDNPFVISLYATTITLYTTDADHRDVEVDVNSYNVDIYL